MISFRQTVLAATALFSSQLFASPWIDANELFLRNHIQQLADAGVLSAPVTTYPLMWNAISADLLNASPDKLSPRLQQSYAQVLHYFNRAQRNQYNHQLKISAANEAKRFNSFGDSQRQQAQLQLSTEYIGSFWAGKLSTQLRVDAEDDNSLTFDNSYLAATYGNWVVRFGAVSQWWGPGWDSSLIMSNNARPLPALSLTRNNSNAFETPWLNWIGPWTFTAQMAKLESERHIPNAMLWSTRATIRPISKLELGLSWSIQWGGDGQPNSLKDFLDAVTSKQECANGADVCDPSLNTKLGNQLAGFDIRWSDSIAGVPFSVYAQTIGEDAVNNIKPADKAYVFGIDSIFSIMEQPIRVFLEYTETEVACGKNPNSLNCYYEHTTYYTGYRYHQRAIGTTYDNDTIAWSLGFLGQFENGQQWRSILRIAQLNTDNIDRAPTSSMVGNQVSKIAEDLVQLELQYQWPMFSGLLTIGGDISHSSYIDKKSKNEGNANVAWEYRY
ncbi:MAG: capsule assembly Wzi family protein [Gammaproteobacteria bacterium]|nr:capsule assembly Wzi family protein [Gammaproteobacteria bacterium]